jgi:hypothetical protein
MLLIQKWIQKTFGKRISGASATEVECRAYAQKKMLLSLLTKKCCCRYLWVWGSNLWRNLNAKFILVLQAVGLQRIQPEHFFGDCGALLVANHAYNTKTGHETVRTIAQQEQHLDPKRENCQAERTGENMRLQAVTQCEFQALFCVRDLWILARVLFNLTNPKTGDQKQLEEELGHKEWRRQFLMGRTMQATFWFCNWKTLHKYVHDFICVFRIHL